MIIGCEDKKSAPAYFQSIRKICYENAVTVQFAHQTSDRTSPPQVVARLQHAIADAEHDLGHDVPDGQAKEQTYWAIIDTDPQAEATRIDQIEAAISAASQSGVNVIVSNPCFEHWLRMHFGEADGAFHSAAQCHASLQTLWQREFSTPYSKKCRDYPQQIERLVQRFPPSDAARIARNQHRRKAAGHDIPPHRCQPCCTDMYRIVEHFEACARGVR